MLHNIMFPARLGLTVGSVEFEKVIEGFEIENKVVFERWDGEAKNNTVRRHRFQEQEGDNVDVSFDLNQKVDETTMVGLRSSFECLSLENDNISTGTKTPRPRNRLYSTPTTSNEKRTRTQSQLSRNSTQKMISGKRSKSLIPEAIFNKEVERSRKASLTSSCSTAGTPIPDRRASLPICVGSYRESRMSPRSPTEKAKSFLDDPNLNQKLPERRRSGPDTYFSKANETPSSGKCSRIRRFSMPVWTSGKFPKIARSTCIGSENDSEAPDNMGKNVPLEHVLLLWNIRLPKAQVIDMKRQLAYEK